MATVVPGPFVGVVVDSGLHQGRPRLLVVPMGVRLPAGVPLVAGALAVAGECPSRGRRSVRAAAVAANGLASAVLPDYASSGAGLSFGFGNAASSLTLAASSRAAAAGRASHGGIVVAATSGSPADGGADGDDATPAEIDEEQQWKDRVQWIKDKEQWMKDGEEKYILGWKAEEEQIKNKEQWIKDGEKYIWGWNAEEMKMIKNLEQRFKDEGGEKYILRWKAEEPQLEWQEWLLLPRVGGASEKEVTATITTMFTQEHALKMIRDFNPAEDVATDDTSLVCKEKRLIEFFRLVLILGAGHLELFMGAYPPNNSEKHEVLVTIGKELKVAATECQRGHLQSESLDRALVAMIRLMGLPADSLDRFDIRARLLQRRGREFAVDDTEQTMTYFMIMAAYTHDVLVGVTKELHGICILLAEYLSSST